MLNARRPAALFIVVGLLTAGLPSPASAAGSADCYFDQARKVRVCKVTAKPPTNPGTTTPVKDTSGARKVTCADQWGEDMDCDPPSSGAWWSADRRCWVEPADPQPAVDDPRWNGRTDGAIYACWLPRPPGVGGSFGVSYFWADSAPAQVNPGQLARDAVDSMNLVPPTVGATPLPKATAVSLIGLPTWLWIEGADEHSWGPITRTAAAGGVTVTATAKVAKVVWDMGDGNTVTCTNKGTEWTPAKGTGDSPTCGYRYNSRGERTITATTYWEVDWSGAGQSGTITFDMSGTRDVNVVELRAVITG